MNNAKAPGKKMYSLEASNVETSDYLPVAFKKKMRKKRKNGKKAKKPEIIEDFIPMEVYFTIEHFQAHVLSTFVHLFRP